MRYLNTIISFSILLGLASCSFYADIPENEIEISEENLTFLKSIQQDISKNFEIIADSNGYFSDSFYFKSDRFERKLKIIDTENYEKLVSLNKKGIVKSLRISSPNCTSYLLYFAEPNYLLDKYWDEVWLVYYSGENSKCGLIDNSYEETIWTRKLDDNWMLIKNKRRRYIGC